MSHDFSLLQILVRLTKERDTLESLLELTPDSHQDQVRAILAQVSLAIDDVTRAMVQWIPIT
jgi:hypothetical protein